MVTSVKPAGAPLSQPRVDPKETIPICSYWAPGMDNGPPESPCKKNESIHETLDHNLGYICSNYTKKEKKQNVEVESIIHMFKYFIIWEIEVYGNEKNKLMIEIPFGARVVLL